MQDHRKPARLGKAAHFTTAAAIAIITVLTADGAACAQPERPGIAEEAQSFSVPPQPLASALIAVAEQADLTLVAPRELVDGKSAPALEGEYTTTEALKHLLEGSGVAFEITGDNRLILRRSGERTDEVGPDDGAAHLDEMQEAAARPPGSADDQPQPNEATETESAFQLEEIVVTGSHIRGAGPTGSNSFVFDRDAIEKTGFGTIQQVLQSLPQNFGGGPNEATRLSATGRADTNRIGLGSGVNLRGLGTDSTLTLLDGRRLARSGVGGAFVDISTIPVSAIERIEIVPDGSSALYGSDAVGGVVNIVLRKDYTGSETRLRFGTVTDGGTQEYQAGQILGTIWDFGGREGNALVSYEYYKRDPLKAEDRKFLTEDLSAFGGNDFRDPGGNPGNITNFIETFAVPPGQDGTTLTPGDLIAGEVNRFDAQEGTTLLPEQQRHSVFVNTRQELTRSLEAFLQFGYRRRTFKVRDPAENLTVFVPQSNPFFVDPFGASSGVNVQFSFIDDLGPLMRSGKLESYNVSGGGDVALPGSWQAELYGSYSRERNSGGTRNFVNRPALDAALADPDPATAFNPFGDGPANDPETLRRITARSSESNQLSELWQVFGKADGTLFSVPGGDVKLALGGEYREETFDLHQTSFLFADPFVTAGARKRKAKAGFGEILIPVVGSANRRPGIERLEISAAGRIEDFSDFGTTADPKVGALWSPLPGLDLRGTFGTSFKAPILGDLVTGIDSFLFDFILEDPHSSSGLTSVIAIGGNNTDLGPEEARSWTVGFDFDPESLPGFHIEVTYFDIEIKNRVLGANDVFSTIFSQEERFADRINRNPDIESVRALFEDANFLNFFGSTPEDIGAIVDFRLRNIGMIRTEGFDLTGSYGIDTAVGRFDFAVNASVFTEFKQSETPTAPLIKILGTVRNPADWRMRNSVSWSQDGFSATAFVNYVDNFVDNESAPERKVNAWATIDLQVAYATGEQPASPWLKNLNISISVQNLLDDDPPFFNNNTFTALGFDPQNASALNRFIAVQLTKRF